MSYHKGVMTGAAPLQAFGDALSIDDHQVSQVGVRHHMGSGKTICFGTVGQRPHAMFCA